MPMYEFSCPHCNKTWEVLCKFSELELLKNSLCRSCCQIAERVVSKISKPVFKGSGFYETDYKKKSS